MPLIPPFCLLDNAQKGIARLYQNWHGRCEISANMLDSIDNVLAQGFAQNLHACLRIDYEFGLALMGLKEHSKPLIIDWYESLTQLSQTQTLNWLTTQQEEDGDYYLRNTCFSNDRAIYQAKIDAIHQHILAGDAYQINYTDTISSPFAGNPAALYCAFRSKQLAPYAVYSYHPQEGYTLCLSPELFLAIDGEHIYSKPMKGTAYCSKNDDEEKLAAALQNDPKNLAENTMIVDLLRNDLSKIARPFSVKVEQPFAVNRHGEVLQMTTEIHAKLRENTPFSSILRATFPCGSITGAPKYMAMQLIENLEKNPRGIYTGAIGYIEPHQNGYKSTLNVAIRTLSINQNMATFGVGSGITIDSNTAEEYQECCDKSGFLKTAENIALFETMLAKDGKIIRFNKHLARIQKSARALNLTMPEILPDFTLEAGQWRVKLLLENGEWQVIKALLTPLSDSQVYVIYPENFPNSEWLRQYKTTHRQRLDSVWRYGISKGAFDALIFNEEGYLLEGGRSNVFIQLIDRSWHTPSLDLDILPGVMRQTVLDNPALLDASSICERKITRAEVSQAKQVVLTNSLRGIIRVNRRLNDSI